MQKYFYSKLFMLHLRSILERMFKFDTFLDVFAIFFNLFYLIAFFKKRYLNCMCLE